jgi:Fic family protein
MATQEVAAVEYANLLACADREPEIAAGLLEQPVEALAALHAEICRGLVAVDVLGRPRRSDQAIHDGAQGRVLYRAPDPETIPGLLGELATWITHGGAGLPPLVVAGVLQERLLEWQPFEAANGRLARAASRVLLRARAVDPEGVAVPERLLAADPAGYYAEVAATRRRGGDPSLWLERYGEALAAALEDAADAIAPPRAVPVPARAREVAEALGEGVLLTVREYAERARVTPATARADLRLLADEGVLTLEPRSRGLRYRRIRG